MYIIPYWTWAFAYIIALIYIQHVQQINIIDKVREKKIKHELPLCIFFFFIYSALFSNNMMEIARKRCIVHNE